jgi:hypothetical protein
MDSSESLTAHPTDLADAHAAAVLAHVLPLGEELADSIRLALTHALGVELPDLGIDLAHPEWHQYAIDITREVLESYRPELTALLTDIQLASLLAGMQRVATLLPTTLHARPAQIVMPVVGASAAASPRGEIATSPKIVPSEAARTTKVATPHGGSVDGPEPAPEPAPPEVITVTLPVPMPAFIAESPEPLEPPEPEQSPPVTSRTGLAMVDEAAKVLRSRVAMTRPEFDALSDEARRRAFTVAGEQTEKTVGKVRDVLADLTEAGPTLPDFARIVEEEVGPGTFLSPGHRETVYRNGISQAFSDGMDKILATPLVDDAFPFAGVYAIHDDRVRKTHLMMETLGIDGTHVFYRNDPVFIKYRGPLDWGCRCGWSPMTVRQAARAGVLEAAEWLRTGHPPENPTFVDKPPFEPSPDFKRIDAVGGDGGEEAPVALSLATFLGTARESPPDMDLWRSIIAVLPKKRPASLPYRCGKVGDAEIILVDGNEVKLRKRKGGKNKKGDDKTFMGFVEGGNGLEDSELCGKDEVFVDALIDPACYPFIAYHECVERGFMLHGDSYDKAHEKATDQEYQLREQFS